MRVKNYTMIRAEFPHSSGNHGEWKYLIKKTPMSSNYLMGWFVTEKKRPYSKKRYYRIERECEKILCKSCSMSRSDQLWTDALIQEECNKCERTCKNCLKRDWCDCGCL